MGADLLHWDTGGKYGLLAVMQGENNGPVFIAEMNSTATNSSDFPKYKYDLSHIGDVAGGEVVAWTFGENQINMGYYATARGVYHFALDEGNRINPTKLTMENNAEVIFEGEITFIKILKPRAIGGKSYYKNNVLMVVGAYGGTSGSGKLYSLELDPNSGKVKSQLGVYAVMVKDVLPAGVKGIVTIGFICALVASLAAFFNSCATLFTEDFYKPMFKNKSEATYVMVGRIATVVVVILGMAWIPVMMSLGSLYDYLQGIQSLLPSEVSGHSTPLFPMTASPSATARPDK